MDQIMSVQVRKSQVRKSPSFLSPVLANLAYGDQVRAMNEENGWYQVNQAGVPGFVHTSALTQKKIILNPDSKAAQKAASSEEYALAGKGFNTEVEERFRSENPHLNFSALDRMEGYGIPESQIRSFLIQGRVYPERGQG